MCLCATSSSTRAPANFCSCFLASVHTCTTRGGCGCCWCLVFVFAMPFAGKIFLDCLAPSILLVFRLCVVIFLSQFLLPVFLLAPASFSHFPLSHIPTFHSVPSDSDFDISRAFVCYAFLASIDSAQRARERKGQHFPFLHIYI